MSSAVLWGNSPESALIPGQECLLSCRSWEERRHPSLFMHLSIHQLLAHPWCPQLEPGDQARGCPGAQGCAQLQPCSTTVFPHSFWPAHMVTDDYGKCCPNHRLPATRNHSDWETVAFWDKPLQSSSLEPAQAFPIPVGLNHSGWSLESHFTLPFLFILSAMNLGIWIWSNLQKHLRMIIASASIVESPSKKIFFFISSEQGKLTPQGSML